MLQAEVKKLQKFKSSDLCREYFSRRASSNLPWSTAWSTRVIQPTRVCLECTWSFCRVQISYIISAFKLQERVKRGQKNSFDFVIPCFFRLVSMASLRLHLLLFTAVLLLSCPFNSAGNLSLSLSGVGLFGSYLKNCYFVILVLIVLIWL